MELLGLEELKADVENECYLFLAISEATHHKWWQRVTRNLLEHARQMRILHEIHPTTQFELLWKEKVNEAGCQASLQCFVEEVWKCVHHQCKEFITSFKIKSVELSKVEETFKDYQADQIEKELHSLYTGLCECERIRPNASWVREVVEAIQHFRRLEQYAEAAKAFLGLKKYLQLTGDFNEVKNISDGVRK